MALSSTPTLARRLGGSLSLTEGLEVPTTLRVSPEGRAAFLVICRESERLSVEESNRYMAEVAALYLPSIFQTFFNNSVDAFEAIGKNFFVSYAALVSVHIPSAVCNRFVREHPTIATELRAKALSLIVDWSNRSDIVRKSLWTDVMKDLVLIYGDLTMADAAALDVDPKATPDPLHISPELCNSLKSQLDLLKTVCETVKHDIHDGLRYALALDQVCAAIFDQKTVPLRGSRYIERLVGGGAWVPWWTCEARFVAHNDPQPVSPCDQGTRDELRVCSRCLAIRYCSERHQKLHWKKHKIVCVAPTW